MPPLESPCSADDAEPCSRTTFAEMGIIKIWANSEATFRYRFDLPAFGEGFMNFLL